ncbi:MAG: cytochrome c family protein [Burkholderiaceae bacterium]|nr:cytochrome c family protein [Burkholderiaceae bacterium]MEB2352735.1 cytochrome c family protein [Burkholderiaceae bacterium]
MKKLVVGICTSAVLLVALATTAEAAPDYEGRKKCGSCHRSQLESWERTAHAKAMDSLAPKAKVAARTKAGLDPNKDYRQDVNCVGCHSTGFDHEGGFDPKAPNKYLTGVGCESCHGAGSDYRLLHRKAGQAFEKKKQTMPRQQLVEAGQEFGFEQRCNACHLNYEGSPWKGAKKPYTPFTPKVDARYNFDYARAVRNDQAMHEHFKLDKVFTGPPVPSFHEEFQSKAAPGVKGKED